MLLCGFAASNRKVEAGNKHGVVQIIDHMQFLIDYKPWNNAVYCNERRPLEALGTENIPLRTHLI